MKKLCQQIIDLDRAGLSALDDPLFDCLVNLGSEAKNILETYEEHEKLTEQRDELLAMLDMLCTGLEWWIDNNPTCTAGSDDLEALDDARALVKRVRGVNT